MLTAAWVLWNNTLNLPSTNTWAPLEEFASAKACLEGAVKHGNRSVQAVREIQDLTPIQPMTQDNVVLLYLRDKLVAITTYSCAPVDQDPRSGTVSPPRKPPAFGPALAPRQE